MRVDNHLVWTRLGGSRVTPSVSKREVWKGLQGFIQLEWAGAVWKGTRSGGLAPALAVLTAREPGGHLNFAAMAGVEVSIELDSTAPFRLCTPLPWLCGLWEHLTLLPAPSRLGCSLNYAQGLCAVFIASQDSLLPQSFCHSGIATGSYCRHLARIDFPDFIGCRVGSVPVTCHAELGQAHISLFA